MKSSGNTKKVKEIRSGYSYFDGAHLKTLLRGTVKNSDFGDIELYYFDGNRFDIGLEKARSVLGEAVKNKKDFVYIKDAAESLPDTMKSAVLYNIWIYWHKILGIGGSYAEFIKEYNEGVI